MMLRSLHHFLPTIILLSTAFITHPLPSKAELLLEGAFEDKLVAAVKNPTDFIFLPTGELLASEKRGELYIIRDPSAGTPAELIYDFADVLCTDGERGVSGLEIHPNFEVNRYIYVFYTHMKGGTPRDCVGVNKLVRFRLPQSTMKVDESSRKVLFTTSELQYVMHNAGSMSWGKDGFLYITTGEGGAKEPSQDLGSLLGKMIRITDEGDIPLGNPFTGADTARCNVDGKPPSGSPSKTKCQEIYCSGLRNPFRFSMNPNVDKTQYFINDVGGGVWEEINEGGDDFVGANYGYPTLEGPCEKGSTRKCKPRDWAQDPIHWYEHREDGHAAVLASVFVPNGIWPEEFDNSYIYSDYVFGEIYKLKLDDQNGDYCRSCTPPRPRYNPEKIADIEKVVSFNFGPYKGTTALYYLTRWEDDDFSVSGIRVIAHTGTANRDPIAIIHSIGPTNGGVGLEVQFDASASEDPDGNGLTYSWDFNGDGDIDSEVGIVTYKYQIVGTYHAMLTVRDGKGGISTDSLRIDIGNTGPLPIILEPEEGTKFAVGDKLTLIGMATDEEDGKLKNSSLTWEVRKHHGNHWHPFLDETQGNNIVLGGAPEPEDLFASRNSYLEIRLTATDFLGLSNTVSRFVQPKKIEIRFDSYPPGLDVLIDGEKRTMPKTIVTWENHELEIKAPNQRENEKDYSWIAWSDGGDKSHSFMAPASSPNEVILATFEIEENDPSPSGTVLTPTDDASIAENKNLSNINYGNTMSLNADVNSEGWNILISFDLSDIDSGNVERAVLRMYCLNSSASGGTFVGMKNTNFDENIVTWENAPNAIGSNLGAMDKVSSGKWYQLDVTQFVKDSVGDPMTIRISSFHENRVEFASKEYKDQNGGEMAPEIKIWYSNQD